MSSVNPDVPAPSDTLQGKVADIARQVSDLVHHAADVVRTDVSALSTHLSAVFTTANVEGLVSEVEAVLALLPPKLAAGEAAVVALFNDADFVAFEKMFTAAGAALLREYLSRKPIPAATITPPASAP